MNATADKILMIVAGSNGGGLLGAVDAERNVRSSDTANSTLFHEICDVDR